MISTPLDDSPSSSDTTHSPAVPTNGLHEDSSRLIFEQWNRLMSDPLLSPHTMKQSALKGLVPELGLRSLHWRYFFSLLPSPTPITSSISTTTWNSYSLPLNHSRSEYDSLRSNYLRSPDGNWCSDYASSTRRRKTEDTPAPMTKGLTKVNVDSNNPLAIEVGNPWNDWFSDLELRREIRQDVTRTFPEIPYFHSSETQDQMVDLLFIFVKSQIPEIGYRQGMHELLALILWIVDLDSLSPFEVDTSIHVRSSSSEDNHTSESLARLILSKDYIEHDTWSIFTSLMKSCKSFYDPTPSITLTSSIGAISIVQPIVATSSRIHDHLLSTIDQSLYNKLNRLGIEPQLYNIRWLRLLFTREFPVDQALLLWDGLFAEDPSLRLTEFISLTMLLRIREPILRTDYSGVLSLLLRFPTPQSTPHSYQVNHLLSQALLLRDSLSSTTAQSILKTNDELGLVSGDLEFLRLDKDDYESERVITNHSAITSKTSLSEGLVGDLARRAEALGLAGALQNGRAGLLGTFNDFVSRGISTQSNLPKDTFSQIPSKAPWEIVQHPHHYPRSLPPSPALNSPEREDQVKLMLSNAIGSCVKILEEDSVEENRRKVVLDVLKHAQDVLASNVVINQKVLSLLEPKPIVASIASTNPPRRSPSPEIANSTTTTTTKPSTPPMVPFGTTQPGSPVPPSPPPKPHYNSKSLGLGANARSNPLPLTGFSTRSNTKPGNNGTSGLGIRKVSGVDPLGVVGK